MKQSIFVLIVLAVIVGPAVSSSATAQNKPASSGMVLTNAYDAFGKDIEGLKRDFGFSAVVEYRGKTILFDAGTDARVFESNL